MKKELNLKLYKRLFLIRRSEEKIIEHYGDNEMRTPMHMSMGEEAICTGVCCALGSFGQVFGTYRSHALYLAQTQDTDNFFAEMYGKRTALLEGKGGSMHLCAPNHGFMGTSAIVGSVIPVAVGAAFANKVKKNNKIVAVFFGDGATEEGAFWESINVACLMKAPVLFVCEDNGLAVHTFTHVRHGYDSITKIISKFNCLVFKEKTTDVEIIYELVSRLLKIIKTKQMPAFLHLSYYRYLEHVGINKDFDIGYRSESEFKKWLKIDPLKIQRLKLINYGVKETEIMKIEDEINSQIDNSILKAKKALFSEKSGLYKGVFSEKDYLL